MTYVVVYGHWFSSRRSDVSFYSKAGKPIAPGPKLYEQTTRVLSREFASRMTARQRAVFLGFPPIKNAKVGDVCSHDSKWSRAVQTALAGFDAERHGVSSTSSARSRACRTRPTPTVARATDTFRAGRTSRTRY